MSEAEQQRPAVACGSCGNPTEAGTVDVTMWQDERLVVIENVPARICRSCQEQFYDENARVAIIRLAENGFPNRRMVREMTVPVFSLDEDAAPARDKETVEDR